MQFVPDRLREFTHPRLDDAGRPLMRLACRAAHPEDRRPGLERQRDVVPTEIPRQRKLQLVAGEGA